MSGFTTLGDHDLRFINLVASRRFGGVDRPAPPVGLDEALASAKGPTPFTRAASLAGELLSRRVFVTSPLQTALLAVCCQLELEGYELLAPQGVAAGMVRDLASGRVDVDTTARWLEDRAVLTRFGA